MSQPPLPNDIRVIAPNLKRRLSGVTATIVRLVPVQARRIGIVATGPGLPPDVPHLPLWRVALLGRGHWRVWHARRNTEMLLGLLLRHVLGLPLVLLFTSAAQRHHKPLTRWLIARMDRVVATSPQAAAYLERPAQVVMHGIDTDIFHPAPDRRALRGVLGLPQDALLVGCFGRIRPQKGIDLLVDAAIATFPARPDAHLIFTGRATGEHRAYQDEMETRIAAAGLADRIRFLGELPWGKVVQHYQALDLFVAPARWEGFGLTPLEAMACGAPVIAARGVGAFEAQIRDGVTGRLVARDDAQALAGALAAMLDDPAGLAAAGQAARVHVLAHFTITREAEALIDVYEALLRDRLPPPDLAERLGFRIARRLPGDRLQRYSMPQPALLAGLAGKRVAIVGNARALAETAQGAQIDAADIVIRINRAPMPDAQSHGSRTDWLALATSIPPEGLARLEPERVLWMSHKRKRLSLRLAQRPGFYLHPLAEMTALERQLGARPTTGLMVLDLVARSDAAAITLHGFDFFATRSLSGRRGAADVPHDFGAEQAFVTALIARDPRVRLVAMTRNPL